MVSNKPDSRHSGGRQDAASEQVKSDADRLYASQKPLHNLPRGRIPGIRSSSKSGGSGRPAWLSSLYWRTSIRSYGTFSVGTEPAAHSLCVARRTCP